MCLKDADSKEGQQLEKGILRMIAWSKQAEWSHPTHFNIVFMGKHVSTCVVLTNFVCLGNTYDVNFRE